MQKGPDAESLGIPRPQRAIRPTGSGCPGSSFPSNPRAKSAARPKVLLGSDPSPLTKMTKMIGRREGSDPGSAGYFSTTSASAATTPSGPTNTGLMSSSFSLGASAVAIWDAATKVLASASLSAAGLPR